MSLTPGSSPKTDLNPNQNPRLPLNNQCTGRKYMFKDIKSQNKQKHRKITLEFRRE